MSNQNRDAVAVAERGRRGGPYRAGATRGKPNAVLRPQLSTVVPCYNEAATLPELHRRLSATCIQTVGDSYEIIFVNDGSSDETWSLIQKLAFHDRHIIGVNLSRNHGHQLALTAGLSMARGHRVLILDADLQDPPELLPRMMTLMDGGADVVYGQRTTRAGETLWKKATASLFYRLLARLTDVPIPVDTGDFRLMSRRALKVLQAMPEQHRFIRGMVSWIGFNQVPLPYERPERFAGETKYPFHKMMRFALDAITGFSTQPLRISSYVSVLLGLMAVALFGYAIVGFLYFRTAQGWTSLMTVVLLLGSAQMFFLGIHGEYLGRLYMQSKQRPLFVISDVVRQSQVATSIPQMAPQIAVQMRRVESA